MTDDEDNPWRWIGTAKVGQPSEVIVGERLGLMHITTPVVLLEDGCWYVIDNPTQLKARPVAWRYWLKSSTPEVRVIQENPDAQAQS